MYSIIIQLATNKTLVPKRSLLKKWAQKALSRKIESGEITIRIVDSEEMSELNHTYRHKTGPTNVLSFPFTLPENINLDIPMLGDIVICAEIVNKEAKEQHKSQQAHWAHMIVHGIFHLLGYDHEKESEAIVMEALEIEIMQSLGFANPYETGENEPL
ncbi:MAG: rRNA maturation RNase YbeY [Gammaproteobacteria bacterium]|nr:rRNA maturation RNase YbeY [Gammaproteobacteria bacterium]MCW5584028.1 rRNA maturation RNase YbeY [Gammaproteobacteria bacterium]